LAPETLIALGDIVNTHATHGEVRVRPFNPDSTALGPGCTVVLRRGAQQQERRVRTLRPHKHFLLVAFEGCESMDAAEALIGWEVCVPETDLPPAGPDEIYHYQLVGMTVRTIEGAEIGTVAEVLSLASNDVCVVRANEREHLIPLIADVVKQIDREQRQLIIDPVPGLLDT
jgi:16S rRNA processing protein RimM